MFPSLKVLIADDHSMIREGLRLLLADVTEELDVLEAEDFTTAESIARDHADLNLVLLDIQLPATKGLEGVARMRELNPLVPIIVISMLEMGTNVHNVMELGINGFIAKSCSREQMLVGISRVLEGEIVILRHASDGAGDIVKLPRRQLETLQLMAEGQSNKEIAKSLGISDTTVREYVTEILRRFHVDNRVQAINAARSAGMLID